MEDCIVYLVWQLRQSKFEVRFTWPNLLYISWRHHEGEYLTRQNPIIKAMMPEPINRPAGGSQKKKGGGGGGVTAPPTNGRPVVAFNNEIDIITNPQHPQQALINGQAQAKVRRAIDYEPPASFVQNMERPGPGRQMNGSHTNGKAQGNVLADLWTY